MSAWVVERLLRDSGLAGEPWVPKALTALRQGTALPPRELVDRSLPPESFETAGMPYGDGVLPPDDIVVADPWTASLGAGVAGPDEVRRNSAVPWPGVTRALPEEVRRHRAVAVMYDAGRPDTLAAVCATVAGVAFEAHVPDDYLDRVRAEFPDLIR